MKDVDGNYKETGHIKQLPEEGHQTVHHAIALYTSPTDDECCSLVHKMVPL